MVLKPQKGSLTAQCSVALVARSPASLSSSQVGEKTPMISRTNSFSQSAKNSPNNGKGTSRELQRSNIESVSSRRFSQMQRRLDLEQDVDKLRKKLRHEEDLHKALERAFRRPRGARPRFSPSISPKTQELLAEVAVLEEEVVRLEEKIVQLKQNLYQKGVQFPPSPKQKEPAVNSEQLKARPPFGRVPSSESLSSQSTQQRKRDLVVRSLLDGIPIKQDTTLGTKGLHRKHISLGSPSEINGLFFLTQAIDGNCPIYMELEEAKALKLPKIQKKKSVTTYISQEKENKLHIEDKSLQTLFPGSKRKIGVQKPSLMQKTVGTLPPTHKEKTGHTAAAICFGPRTSPTLRIFDDDKNAQPNKLSEEIVKILLSIFSRLSRSSLAIENDTASVISRSTFSSLSLRSYGSRSSLSFKTPMDRSEEIFFRDPYGVCSESVPRDIGPYKHFQDITASSFDLNRIPGLASLLRRVRILVNKLCSTNLKGLKHQQKLAFWINIYNACMMHAFLEHGIPSTPEKVVALMRKANFNVGGYFMSALAIEHFILRPPFHSQDAYWKKGKAGEEARIRSVFGLGWSEPMVTFALCCGSRSSPAVRVYTADEVESELEVAKKEYLQASIGFTTKKVLIPKLLDWYMRDFAKDLESLLEWICEQLPTSLKTAVEKCLQGNRDGFISQAVEVMPYDFEFRYLLP
ncbi:uncharacterized protein LOC131041933 [Cryptomeria japonica]|uniref:uncharacterized protein LOC131041933 n=1 Tax=Cryptomeria japonica TaxID=3369 RepID=UPI0027DA2446|nr:uncharacterized protein LOC131041933 [Cryptomeria japonica]